VRLIGLVDFEPHKLSIAAWITFTHNQYVFVECSQLPRGIYKPSRIYFEESLPFAGVMTPPVGEHVIANHKKQCRKRDRFFIGLPFPLFRLPFLIVRLPS
jgi:hypothetical protein